MLERKIAQWYGNLNHFNVKGSRLPRLLFYNEHWRTFTVVAIDRSRNSHFELKPNLGILLFWGVLFFAINASDLYEGMCRGKALPTLGNNDRVDTRG